MKKRTGRIISAAVAAAAGVSLLLPSAVSAQSYRAPGACHTVTTIKKAASPVVHDGVISPGEYEAIPIVKDLVDGDITDECDLLLGYVTGNGYEYALQLLQNINFYISWDETNGVNFAVTGIIPETPRNLNKPEDWAEDHYVNSEGVSYPSDEFVYQLGAAFDVRTNEGTADAPDYKTLAYRGFTRNTESNEMLYGWYTQHGYDDYLLSNPQVAGRDYDCKIDMASHFVVYELSFPFQAVLPSSSYNGNVPNDGAEILFEMSLVGGGVGIGSMDSNSYSVCLGDNGFMSTYGADGRPATGIFSSAVVGSGTGGTGTTDPGTTTPGTTTPGTTTPGTTTPGTTTPGTTTPGTTTPGTTTPGTTTPGNNNNPNNSNKPSSIPQTGDAMTILAALSALSAGGVMISKKRR